MKLLRISQLLLFVLLVLDWIVQRKQLIPNHPPLFAAMVGVLQVLLISGIAANLIRVFRRRVRLKRALPELLIGLGLSIAIITGFVNWMYSLEGYVILTELQAIPLSGGTHLQEFESGPLARIDEMELTLQLEELRLVAAGGGFYPESRIRCRGSEGAIEVVTVGRGSNGEYRSLRFHQGAFGFTPRIVIVKEGETVFDRFVPFLTERRGRSGITFEGEFTLAAENLRVSGAVSLDSLDEQMRGHSNLVLDVSQGAEKLGQGRLLPGQFAEIGGGYRVGFAGLRKWSEIDIARRNYPGPVFAGFGIALLGIVMVPVAIWWDR